MRIVEFAFVVYPTTDLTRSRAFYEDALGLRSATSINIPDRILGRVRVGPHTLAIGKEPFLKPSGDGPHIALEVDDFDETIEHLRRRKVRFAVEPFDLPGCRPPLSWTPRVTNSVFINERLNQAFQRCRTNEDRLLYSDDSGGHLPTARASARRRSNTPEAEVIHNRQRMGSQIFRIISMALHIG